MKREDLAPQLQKLYKIGSDCGVEKGLVPEYENLFFVIAPPPLKKINFNLDLQQLKLANKILPKLTSISEMTELDKLVSFLFVKREALSSSRMEGTYSTMDLLLTPSNMDILEEVSGKESILSYANVLINSIDNIQKNKFKFDHKLIKNIHLEIMQKDPHYRGVAGVYREKVKASEYVFIGGRKKENSIYNPTPPHHVKKSLDRLLDWLTDEEFILQSEAGAGLPFLVRMALCHSNFEAIHPFMDGNGRVGRILLSLHMMSEGYSPLFLSGFIEEYKEDYIKALEESQKKLNHAPLVNFLSEAVVASYEETTLSKKVLLDLQVKWTKLVKPRKGSAAAVILEKILERPIFTAQQLIEWFQFSKPAIYNAISQLVEAGVVRERTGSERFRVFAAEEVVEILSRDFGESVESALEKAEILLNK